MNDSIDESSHAAKREDGIVCKRLLVVCVMIGLHYIIICIS
jgi:hypothetical protein